MDNSNFVPASEISRVLADLMKTIKAVSVYPENNPVPTKLKESFIERFTELIQDSNGLKFTIHQNQIYHNDRSVYADREDEDALAGLFFNSGINEISFDAAFDYENAGYFFRTIKKYVNREEGAQDLSSLLWQAAIEGFSYSTVEDIALKEYDGNFAVQETNLDDSHFIKQSSGSDSDSGKVQYASIFLNDSDEVAVATAPPPPGLSSVPDDPAEKYMGLQAMPERSPLSIHDTAMILNNTYMLEESDRNFINRVLDEDGDFDMFDSTIDLLREIIFHEQEYPEFNETVTIMEKIQTEFLKVSQLDYAGMILSNLQHLSGLLDERNKVWKDRIQNALDTACGHEKFSYLKDILNENASIGPDALGRYLDHFDWKAVSAAVDLLGELEHRDHRFAVCDFLSEQGKDQVDLIAKGIFDRRWFVVRNAVDILARIGNDKAISYLEKALNHQEPRVRLQIIRGLNRRENEKSTGLLIKLVWDPDAIVSQMAFESILNLTGTQGLNVLTTIINDDRFATLSERHQEKCILMLSKLGGEHTVNYLVSLINGWGAGRSQIREFYQRVAFNALAHNRSEKAEKALLKLAHSWRKNLRKMATEALKKRREIKTLGEQ
nr:HEAT repeat domain-containing protein [candidate division Zixibacteria bacterium]